MEYVGRLYGKIGKNYFDTGVTSKEYDELKHIEESISKENYVFEITYKLRLMNDSFMETTNPVVAIDSNAAICKLKKWRKKIKEHEFKEILIINITQSPYYLVI